jgi:putative transposase
MRPARLVRLFEEYERPIYFVTCCTLHRKPWLGCEQVDAALRDFGIRGQEMQEAALGRYVLMPDHVHLFVRLQRDKALGAWVKALKAKLLRAAGNAGRSWQPDFFDHVIRSRESYSQKWNYVCENPARAGLVEESRDWPYQGEIVTLFQV